MARGTNFSFIERDRELKAVFAAGLSIEDLIEFNQNLTMIKERYFIETLVKYLLTKNNIKSNNAKTLQAKLDLLKYTLKSDHYQTLYKIKELGNKATHEGAIFNKEIHKDYADKLFILLKELLKNEKHFTQSQITKPLDRRYFATYLGKNEIETIINTKCEQIENCLRHNSISPSQFELFNKKFQVLEQKLANSQKNNLVTKSDLQNFADTMLIVQKENMKKLTSLQISNALSEMNKTKQNVLYELTKLEERVGKLEISIHELIKTTINHETRIKGLEKNQHNLEIVENSIQNVNSNINRLKSENHDREIRGRQFHKENIKQSVDSVNQHTKTTVNKGLWNLGILITFLVTIVIGANFIIHKIDSPSALASPNEGEIVNDITGKVTEVRHTDKGYIFIDIKTSDGSINIPIFDTKKIETATEIHKGDTLSVSGEFDIYEGQRQIKPERSSDIKITKKNTTSGSISDNTSTDTTADTNTQNTSPTPFYSNNPSYSGTVIDKYVHKNGHIFLTVQTLDEIVEVPLFVSINPTNIFEIDDIIEFSGEENYYKGKKQIIPESMDDIKKVIR